MKEYYSLPKKQVFNSEIEIQKSRFLGFAKYASTPEEAMQFVKEIRQKYKDAKHVVYAYVIDGVQKSSDDKEPSGTAGKPMLEYLLHNNINCIVVAIVRYFGGIKLGTGGLLRAYQCTCKDVVHSHLCKYAQGKKYRLIMSYSAYQDFQKTHSLQGIKIADTKFDQNVIVDVIVFDDNTTDGQFLGDVFEAVGENNATN